MALQEIGYPVPIPYPWGGNTAATWSDQVLTTGQKSYSVFPAPKAGNIVSVSFRVGATVTTGGSVDVRVETVALTTYVPTGTLAAAGSDGSVSVTTGDANSWVTCTLNTPLTVTKGQILGVVGTVAGASASFQLSRVGAAVWASTTMSWNRWNTGSWGGSSGQPAIYVTYDDGTEPMIWGADSFITGSSNSESVVNGSEAGFKFQLPFPARLVGAWHLRFPFITSWKLYSAAESLLQTWTFANTGYNSTGQGSTVFMFPTSYDIDANTDYYLVVPYSANTSITQLTYPTSRQDWKPWPLAYRASTGVSFTNTPTKRICAGLLIDGFSDASGGSGGVRLHNSMGGGF